MNRPCPRCGDNFDDRYAAASRATPDRDIEICGPCGTDEATGAGTIPVAQWPLTGEEMSLLSEL